MKEIRKKRCTDTKHTQPARRRRKARNIPRRILIGPQPRRINRARIANRIDQGNGNRPFRRRLRDHIGHPRLHQRRAAVDGAEGEDGEHVLSRSVGCCGHGNEEDAAYAGEAADEFPFSFVSVGEVAAGDHVDEGGHVCWDCMIY